MQKGSNITSERLRLDFNFDRKLTKEELERIEDRVNAEIQKSCEVIREEMSPEEAFKQGAIGAFEHKYGSCIIGYSIASALSGIMDTRGMKLYQKPSSTPPKISKIELKLFEEALRIAAKK